MGLNYLIIIKSKNARKGEKMFKMREQNCYQEKKKNEKN